MNTSLLCHVFGLREQEVISTDYKYSKVCVKIMKDLKEEARQAVLATSGGWEPAMVNGKPVASWVVVPVIFKMEPDPTLP